ncbi:hypothetical protein XOCgx_2468 [Xanthomonas oryzae pv. oryzicola]|nr:hypothetical protein XOCgx_2468 [Xanthomonas oryzae pv. oryzicola]
MVDVSTPRPTLGVALTVASTFLTPCSAGSSSWVRPFLIFSDIRNGEAR